MSNVPAPATGGRGAREEGEERHVEEEDYDGIEEEKRRGEYKGG